MSTAADTTGRPRHQYHLALPVELHDELKRIAAERDTTVMDILRRFVKLGLIAAALEDTPGAMLIVRDGGVDRQIVLI